MHRLYKWLKRRYVVRRKFLDLISARFLHEHEPSSTTGTHPQTHLDLSFFFSAFISNPASPGGAPCPVARPWAATYSSVNVHSHSGYSSSGKATGSGLSLSTERSFMTVPALRIDGAAGNAEG